MNGILTPWQRLISGIECCPLEPLRAGEAAHFYWCTDIKTPEISRAYFGGVHSSVLPDAIGPAVFSSLKCTRCDGPVYAFSRSNATGRVKYLKQCDEKWRGCNWADPRVCHECMVTLKNEQDAPRIAEWKVRENRLSELKYMPYADYLRTPEWKAAREAAVKRARGCCQTCASTDRLNVHHRTYARRGNEYSSDLIVLCQPCHSLFHENRQLAEGGRAAA